MTKGIWRGKPVSTGQTVYPEPSPQYSLVFVTSDEVPLTAHMVPLIWFSHVLLWKVSVLFDFPLGWHLVEKESKDSYWLELSRKAVTPRSRDWREHFLREELLVKLHQREASNMAH
jgi:hypothetical protein